MKAGWETRRLEEIAAVGAGNPAPQRKEYFAGGRHPFIRTSDIGQIRFGEVNGAADLLNDEGIRGLRRVPAGTVLMPKSGASTFLNHRVIMCQDAFVSSHLATITAHPAKLESRFLLYALYRVRAQDLLPENSYPSLNLSLISDIKVPVPPLEEQRRIVTVLDEAFEGLDRACANAEANLASARELFESFLSDQFVHGGIGNKSCTVGELITLQRGYDITKSDQREGSFPVISSGGTKSHHDSAMAKGPGVVVGRKGSIGSVYYVDDDFWPHDTTLFVRDFKGNDARLTYYSHDLLQPVVLVF